LSPGDGRADGIVTVDERRDRRSALDKQIASKSAPKRTLGYNFMDLFVVAACSLSFAVVIGPGRHGDAKGPPIALIARDLGTTPEQFRQATDRFLPRFPLGPPNDAQKRQVATALDVSVERLDSVMEKYRPDRLQAQ
jgi:hypothetical protein